jgi:hypothetical protein
MQQWEDWRAGYNWQVLGEKAAATLLVVAISLYLWRLTVAARHEAHVRIQVELPLQLSGRLPDNASQHDRAKEEVRPYVYPRLVHDNDGAIGRQWQNISMRACGRAFPPMRPDHSSHRSRYR